MQRRADRFPLGSSPGTVGLHRPSTSWISWPASEPRELGEARDVPGQNLFDLCVVKRGSKRIARGLNSAATWGRAQVPDHIAEPMMVPLKSEVVIRRRVLFDKKSGQAEEIGTSYIPLEIAGGTFLEKPAVVPKALSLCVEDLSGKRYVHAKDQWIVRSATPEEGETFDIPAGSSVLHVVHAASADDGQILEVSESIWPADRIMLVDEYDVEQDARQPDAPSEV